MITQLLTPTHVAILMAVLLLVFGPRRLPETGRALGRGLREFREGLKDRYDGPDPLPRGDAPHDGRTP
jgi:sec-independent protein translocase protein TatA